MQIRSLYLAGITMLLASCAQMQQNPSDVFKESLNTARQHYSMMLGTLITDTLYPRTVNEDGTLELVMGSDWTSGFFPGSLWLLYEYFGEDHLKEGAVRFTESLEPQKFDTGTHDVGFIMYNSFGQGLRLTDNEAYADILVQSAKSLSTRYNEQVGCIKSWDWSDAWDFPVIIDNMMNLELLTWASKKTGDSMFRDIALSHANTTMKNHFRDDNSSWHVVNYDSQTGEVIGKQTWQGASDESAWARGQAWGLYGYTMMYRETGEAAYLQQAEKIAAYLIQHLPDDYITYWDFNALNIPDEPRDASAAAIMASALIELSGHSGSSGPQYLDTAEKILLELSGEKYLAQPGINDHFILKHSVGSKPAESEVDVPLNYADYYFIEALTRYLKLNQ